MIDGRVACGNALLLFLGFMRGIGPTVKTCDISIIEDDDSSMLYLQAKELTVSIERDKIHSHSS